MNAQQQTTILWILCAAAYMPRDWHLLFPLAGLLLEARAFYRKP